MLYIFQARIQVLNKATCEANYAPVSRVKISDNQLCAGTGDKDTCTGDSGGPMLSDQVRVLVFWKCTYLFVDVYP